MKRIYTFYSRNWILFISVFTLIAFINLTISCNYYKVITKSEATQSEYSEFQKDNRYFIIHYKEEVYHLNSIKIENEQFLTGYKEKLPENHKMYLKTNPESGNRYKKNTTIDESNVLNEIHIYANEYLDGGNTLIKIPVNSISKIELYQYAGGRTTLSWFASVFGILSGAIAIIAIIALATKSSCPFIYSKQGDNYVLEGEIYSGAISAPAERNDYLPLNHIDQTTVKYHLKMTNEVNEIQSTNFLELIAVDHQRGSTALIDKYGKIHTINQYINPTTATNLKGDNILPILISSDSLAYTTNDPPSEENLKESIILTFKNIKNSEPNTLILNAKNTFWLDYAYGKFLDLFGDNYEKWRISQNQGDREEMHQWSMDQGIPLSIYIENNNSWEFLDYYDIVGPMAYKKIILPINTSEHKTDVLKLKLEWGYMFWDIDYAALGTSESLDYEKHYISPINAIDKNSENVLPLLSEDDKKYQILNKGDHVSIDFELPHKDKNLERTFILHSKGYYEVLRDTKGKPDINYLKSFASPGQFNKFSNEKLKQSIKEVLN